MNNKKNDKNFLVIANWKMNLDYDNSIEFLKKLAEYIFNIKYNSFKYSKKKIDIIILPNFTSIISLQDYINKKINFKKKYYNNISLSIGAQDLSNKLDYGSFTGEISGRFLRDIRCQYVIIGHSERRDLYNETDSIINIKLNNAYCSHLSPILCIGERWEQREKNTYLKFLEQQLRSSLSNININNILNNGLTIAYEPIWSIGTGKVPNILEIIEVKKIIISSIFKIYKNSNLINKINIIYGGSLNSDNINNFYFDNNIKENIIDGILLGGASLNIEQFCKIIDYIIISN